MRKTIASTGLAVLILGAGAMGVASRAEADPGRAGPKPDRATALARADKVLTRDAPAIRGVTGERYTVRGTVIDESGASHVRYDRTYRNLRVRGGDFVVHNAPDGAFTGATVAQQKPISVAVTPKLSAGQATAAAKKVFRGTLEEVAGATLVVDATGATARLAYEVNLEGTQADGTPSDLVVVIDAVTGAVIDQYNHIKHVAGRGESIYSGTVRVDTTESNSTFSMVDPLRGNGTTCDLNGGGRRSKCTTFTDADNVWGNGTVSDRQSAAADAHYGAALTYDYYKNVLGRAGVFGDGRGVPSRVHFGHGYNNAFWDPETSTMNYGDGFDNLMPLVSIDVAGHEMTHGVTERTADLIYSGESGGLNEATSDIFATMVEYAANNPADPGDYDIGEKIDFLGTGKPLRFMYKPSLDGDSPDCYYAGIGGLDVHYSSGVGNHYFYLLAEGSNGGPKASPTCGAPAVTGIGRDKAAKIHYRALSTYWVSTTNYASARAGTLKAAADLYGECGTEYKTVRAAWAGAGVTGSTACPGDPDPGPGPGPGPDPEPDPGPGKFENDTDVPIPDGRGVLSSITVTGRPGRAPSALKLNVDVKHPDQGELAVDLIAPDGTTFDLQYGIGKGTENLIKTYTVDASAHVANGTWQLRVYDLRRGNTGKIDAWSLEF